MKAFGKGRKRILNIGEAPGETEDRKGRHWQGKVGRNLQRLYRRFGIDLFEDCININAVNCRPAKNRTPTNYEIACCRHTVKKAIEEFKPHVIVLFGNAAVLSVIGDRWKKNLGSINKWRGWQIPDRDLHAWVCPVFHPSFMERSKDQQEVETIWEKDIENALQCLDRKFPDFQDDIQNIEIVEAHDIKPLLELFTVKYSERLVFIDYETTGIKPHARGHRIVCTALSPDPHKAYVFMGPKSKIQKRALSNILTSPVIGKAAANMKFEHVWSLIKLGVETKPWVWDTMQAAHVLDNRPGVTGLKFQVYVQLGVADYDSHINPFLTGRAPGEDLKSANSINRIFELVEKDGGKELMTYCALDTLYEHQLGLIQMERIGYSPF
jgi:DNA polymerase